MDNLIVMLFVVAALLVAESIILAALLVRLAKSTQQGRGHLPAAGSQPQSNASDATPERPRKE